MTVISEEMLQEIVAAASEAFRRVLEEAPQYDKKIKLIRTGWCFPESYDAFLGDEKVGYLWLRHGNFTVECPDCGGDRVYRANPLGDGTFLTDIERHRFLNAGCKAILKWLEDNKDSIYYVENAADFQDPWYDYIDPNAFMADPKPDEPPPETT